MFYFALIIEGLFLTSFGAKFHDLVASLMHVLMVKSLRPGSTSLLIVWALVTMDSFLPEYTSHMSMNN